MARHRTHAEAPRSKLVSIRLTEADFTKLKLDAGWAKMSISGFAERLVRERKITVLASDLPAPMHPGLLAELKRIGNNLNQIAHALNSNLPPDVSFTAKSLHQLIHLMGENELLGQRAREASTRMTKDDSASASAREEFQRSVRVHPARSSEGEL